MDRPGVKGSPLRNRCPTCHSGRLARDTRETRVQVAGSTFVASLPVRRCASCGEAFYAVGAVEGLELQVAALLAEAGVASGEALRFMRKALGLRADEWADLIGVRPESVSRWENGRRRIDRGTLAVIHQLVVEHLRGDSSMHDYLADLRAPRRLPKRVQVKPRAARGEEGRQVS